MIASNYEGQWRNDIQNSVHFPFSSDGHYYPGACFTNVKKILPESFWQKSWLWLADANTSASHNQAFC